MTRWKAALPLVFAATIHGCGDAGDAHSVGPIVRDSAGVLIVDNSLPVWSPTDQWRVDPQPRVALGTAAGAAELQFDQIRGVRVLSDDRIAVADAGSAELRIFNGDGTLDRIVGRRGQGPGEFDRITGLMVGPGDTIAVAELGRVQLFDPSGALIETLPLLISDFRYLAVQGLLADRSFVASSMVSLAPEDMYFTTYFLSPELAIRDSLPPVLMRTRSAGVASNAALYPRGTAAIGAEWTYQGFSGKYEIQQYGVADGELRQLIRRDHTPQQISTEEEAALETYFAERPPRRLLPGFIHAENPATLPAFRQLQSDPAGNLWVETYSVALEYPQALPAPEWVAWSVFREDGAWLGEVDLPGALQPHDIGEDYVAGVARDELGIERVMVYDLVKP